MFLIKKILLYLLYARRGVYIKNSGLRREINPLASLLPLRSKGLSPDVTLFSFHRKQYVSVSFSKVLSLFKYLVTTTNAQAVILDKIKKLLTDRREIGNSGNTDSLAESLGLAIRFPRSDYSLITERGCYI